MSSAKMRVLKPKIDEINKKYPKQEDAMKKQQEVMGLYSQYGVSPMGGCLPMLLQFPILMAFFMFVPSAIELRQQSFLWQMTFLLMMHSSRSHSIFRSWVTTSACSAC